MYNIFFSLPGTVVVEFGDLINDRLMVTNHLVPHRASSFLGQVYYTIPQIGTQFLIELTSIQNILDKEFPITT